MQIREMLNMLTVEVRQSSHVQETGPIQICDFQVLQVVKGKKSGGHCLTDNRNTRPGRIDFDVSESRVKGCQVREES
jgi:hypothetical protein